MINTEIPAPANWQDFEELCFLLWSKIWEDHTASKNGRAGQPQNGVDVYGRPQQKKETHGVQCKGKSNYLEKELTLNEIESEISKATNFLPTLSHLTFATTAGSSSTLYKKVAEISRLREAQGSFSIDVKSWDEISPMLKLRRDVLAALYANILPEIYAWKKISNGVYQAEIVVKHAASDLKNIFEKELTQEFIHSDLRKYIWNFAFEILLNAQLHGEANLGTIEVTSNAFTILDNGKPFSLEDAAVKNSFETERGLAYIKALPKRLPGVELKSKRSGDYNYNSIIFPGRMVDYKISNTTFRFKLSDMDLWHRSSISKIPIPNDASLVVIHVNEEFMPLSSLCALISFIGRDVAVNARRYQLVVANDDSGFLEEINKQLQTLIENGLVELVITS